ncbi:MAG: BMP family ABC transporter substrate-binding protein [Spirochaetia bacterium]|jgi:basic membrane lipoprotein Med (substrate-binding protein (PBP1-ABC) superfamily)
MKTLKCIAVSLLLAAGFAAAPAMAQEKPTLIVGAIYVGSVNDYGYNRSFKDGLEEMKKNIPGLKLLEAENVPETADSERVMESMIQQGAKLIFPTSFGHMDFAMNVAARHPDVYFYHAGGYKVTPNFGNFFGNTQTAWYPIGIAAGKMTKTNKIGFVVGQPIGYALGNVNAFEMGARSVNPKAQTIVVFTNSWSDKAKEAAAANALLDQGCDILTMHVDSPATIIQTAEARGAMSIGFQSIEARRLAPKGWITGMGFTWGKFMTQVAQSVIDGNLKPGFVRQGFAEGMLAVAPFGPSVPAATQKLVTDAVASLDKGFNPFTGPIKDNRGAVRIAQGESWGGDKMGDFDWFVEGVVGQAK